MVWLALVVATLLKILWASHSMGSIDSVLFYNFGREVQQFGLTEVYRVDEKFNHTPLTGLFAWGCARIAGSDKLEFAFLLRLAGIVADFSVVAVLLRWRPVFANRPPWWALVIFAASPVSLMISGFHGNVDSVMVALLFFATVAAATEQPLWCGCFFGLAADVKIVPIILAPVFLCFWFARRGGWRFAITAGLVILAGLVLPLANCPREFVRNVFGYGSYWGVWGVPYLMREALSLAHHPAFAEVQKIDFRGLTTTQNTIAIALKIAALSGIIFVGWLRRKLAPGDLAATLGLAWMVLLILAPGVGVQYMVWAAPFVLLLTAPGYLFITAASTVFLFAFYESTSGGNWPWFFAMPRGPETPVWSAWGVCAWLSFVAVFAALTWQRGRSGLFLGQNREGKMSEGVREGQCSCQRVALSGEKVLSLD
ncbi:MAG: DUF2029 domain-containing protein [Verrucomicrobiota bacterium]|nr:DUF2029 domain-containing protein [Verrucomicrobiota bacterium]